MPAKIRKGDLKTRKDGKTIVEVKKSTYRQKQRKLKADRQEKAWRTVSASKNKDNT